MSVSPKEVRRWEPSLETELMLINWTERTLAEWIGWISGSMGVVVRLLLASIVAVCATRRTQNVLACLRKFADSAVPPWVCVATKGVESFAIAFGLFATQFQLIYHSFVHKCVCMYVLFAVARSHLKLSPPATHICGTLRFSVAIPKSKQYFAFPYHRLAKPNIYLHKYLLVLILLSLQRLFHSRQTGMLILFRSIEISFHANTKRLNAIFAENSLSKLFETDFSKRKMKTKDGDIGNGGDIFNLDDMWKDIGLLMYIYMSIYVWGVLHLKYSITRINF